MAEVFQYPGLFEFENGYLLKGLEITYTTKGRLWGSRSKVVWVIHALTANSDFTSWWPGLLDEDQVFDEEEYFIICANNLGSCYGTTGPLSLNPTTGEPYYRNFPSFTIRDMANVLKLLANHLGIVQIDFLIGASLGGQIALEWAIELGPRLNHLVLLATNAAHSPWGVAFNTSQRMAIEADATWNQNHPDAGKQGLATARTIALLSYRSYRTYQLSQAESGSDKVEHFLAEGYQKYQGLKFTQRFNAFSYFLLTKAMDSHNVSRGRGSFNNALKGIVAKTVIYNIESDILFPLSEQQLLAREIPDATLIQIYSDFGHDGFLLETKKIAKKLNHWKQNKLQEI